MLTSVVSLVFVELSFSVQQETQAREESKISKAVLVCTHKDQKQTSQRMNTGERMNMGKNVFPDFKLYY